MLGGVGYAFIFVPLNVMLFKTVPQPDIPSALALTRLAQQIGASVGSAYAATLLDRGYDVAPQRPGGLGFAEQRDGRNASWRRTARSAAAQLNALVTSEAQNIAATDATAFFALLTMCAAVLPFALQRHREPRR